LKIRIDRSKVQRVKLLRSVVVTSAPLKKGTGVAVAEQSQDGAT
jgi:hypothetical protein